MSDKQRSFQDVLTDLDDGRVHEQLTELLPKLVQAARDTKQPATLTLALTIAADRGTRVSVSAKVSSKVPAGSLGATLFYTDDSGNPSRHDPKQQTLDLAVVRPIGTKGGVS